jgi:hypothetical protein
VATQGSGEIYAGLDEGKVEGVDPLSHVSRKDGGSLFHRNLGICRLAYTARKSGRLTSSVVTQTEKNSLFGILIEADGIFARQKQSGSTVFTQSDETE